MTSVLHIVGLNPASSRMREDAARLHAGLLPGDAASPLGAGWLSDFYYRHLAGMPGVSCRLAYLRGAPVGLIVMESNHGRSVPWVLERFWPKAFAAAFRPLCNSPRQLAAFIASFRRMRTPLPRRNNLVHLAVAPRYRDLVEGMLLSAAIGDLRIGSIPKPRELTRAA